MKKNYTISIPVGTFWKVIVPVTMLICIIGGIAGLFIVDRYIMPNLPEMSNRGIVEVPDISAFSWKDARDKLYAVGLRLKIQAREYNDTLEDNIILFQSPRPGEKVKKGRHIFTTVSKGSEVAKVPDIKGSSEYSGKRTMTKAGFENIIVFRVFSKGYKNGNVCMTAPAFNTVVSREITVKIYISKGPKPTSAQVPNVIGDILSVAKRKITQSNLQVGKINYRMNVTAKPGTVISQSLSPGRNASLESPVDLVVAAKR